MLSKAYCLLQSRFVRIWCCYNPADCVLPESGGQYQKIEDENEYKKNNNNNSQTNYGFNENSKNSFPLINLGDGSVSNKILTPQASQQCVQVVETSLIHVDHVSKHVQNPPEDITTTDSDLNCPPLNFNIDLKNDLKPPLGEARPIGRGGFASVLKSTYCGFPVAIKHFHPEHQGPLNKQEKDAFKHELSIISQLNHKNIVKFYGASYKPDKAIIMEYVEYSLDYRMDILRKNNRRFKLENIFRIIKAITSGLDYLHSKKIVHRDLHPKNVLVSKDGSVKVADVGISKILQHSGATDSDRGGLINYLAPEIFKGFVHSKSDIYSLGIIVHELWTLDETWKNLNWGFLFHKLNLNERPQIPDNMPQNLQNLITSCWQQDYQKRPTALEVHQQCQFELAILTSVQETQQ